MTSNPAATGGAPLHSGAGGEGPRHVAIIMDGNGRWAAKRGLPRVAGHRAGAEAVRRTLKAAVKNGIEVLTLYAFSSENWRRSEEEVSDSRGCLYYLERELDSCTRGVRLLPDWRSCSLRAPIGRAARTGGSQDCWKRSTDPGCSAQLRFPCRDRWRCPELAAKNCCRRTRPSALTKPDLATELMTSDLPELDCDPHLRRKTPVELPLWQAAYAELVFTDTSARFRRGCLARSTGRIAGRQRRSAGDEGLATRTAVGIILIAIAMVEALLGGLAVSPSSSRRSPPHVLEWSRMVANGLGLNVYAFYCLCRPSHCCGFASG